MKSSYTNFDDLLADVYSGVENILCKDVAPNLEAKLKQSAETNVHPRDLSQANDGGITAAKNIVSNVTKSGDTFTLIVKDIAKPQGPKYGEFDEAKNAAMGGTMFANWIENGLWIDLGLYNSYDDPDRNFYTNRDEYWAAKEASQKRANARREYYRSLPMDDKHWARDWKKRTVDECRRPARPFITPVQLEAAMIVKTALHGL